MSEQVVHEKDTPKGVSEYLQGHVCVNLGLEALNYMVTREQAKEDVLEKTLAEAEKRKDKKK